MMQEIENTIPENDHIIIYRKEDISLEINVRYANETVWLTQEQIAILFGVKRPAITKHLKNIYDSGELDVDITCSILEHVGNDGKQTAYGAVSQEVGAYPRLSVQSRPLAAD